MTLRSNLTKLYYSGLQYTHSISAAVNKMASPSSCFVCIAIYYSFLFCMADHFWHWKAETTYPLMQCFTQALWYSTTNLNVKCDNITCTEWAHHIYHSRGVTCRWPPFYPQSKHFKHLLKEFGTTNFVLSIWRTAVNTRILGDGANLAFSLISSANTKLLAKIIA